MRQLLGSRSMRGVLVLGIMAVVTAGLLAGPVTAAGPVTKKQVKRIAKRIATQVVNDLTYTKPQADSRFAPRLFAVVASDGTLVRGSGVTGVTKTGTGFYRVAFDRTLTSCSGVASTGGYALGPGSSTGTNIGQAHVSVPVYTAGPEASQATVHTTDSNGAAQDRVFHLIVVC